MKPPIDVPRAHAGKTPIVAFTAPGKPPFRHSVANCRPHVVTRGTTAALGLSMGRWMLMVVAAALWLPATVAGSCLESVA